MASKSSTSLALFFSLNLLFFSLVTACGSCGGTGGGGGQGGGGGGGRGGGGGGRGGGGGGGGRGGGGGGANPNPNPNPTPTPSSRGTCPRDALKLGICADVLGGLLNVTVGTPPVTPCCSLIQGLADLEAAVCLCTAIRANILGINLNIPVSLSLLLNVCSRNVPSGFQCA